MAAYDSWLFLSKFMRNPNDIGSVIPSSRFLAQQMVNPIPWSDTHAVAELGAGTGSITRFIQSQALETTKVLLFEKDELMRSKLELKFPHFTCHSNASQLTQVIKHRGIQQLDCVISGLPFFNFPNELRKLLMHQIADSLKTGGYFIAFQYSLQMRNNISHDFNIERVKFVPCNFPPAFVYVCRKKGQS